MHRIIICRNINVMKVILSIIEIKIVMNDSDIVILEVILNYCPRVDDVW